VKGLTSEEAVTRQDLVGKNEIAFKVDSFRAGIWKEFTGIFYIYQLMQIIIWYYYAYYYMALVVNVVIIVSGVVKVVVARKAQAQILGMARFSSKTKVLRDGKWSDMDSEELVPGDIFQVETSERPVPVDCLLLQGGVVMDESSLTGEALPVAKFALKNDTESYNHEDNHNTYFLFAGCKILEVKPADENTPVLAFVTATGAATAKGHLVRDILYPVPFRFIFTEHLKVVVAALLVWGFVLLLLSMYFLNTMDTDSWFYGMTSISQILSPLLPAVLVMGQSIATERLRKKGIMCLDLNRITLAGKVKLFCFDKTGNTAS
jgi:cation-transporting ATPase 13A3/4/5